MYENIYKQCRVEVDKEIIDKPVGLGTKKKVCRALITIARIVKVKKKTALREI